MRTGYECVDTDGGATDSYGQTCAVYVASPSRCFGYDNEDFDSADMCCACGGGTVSPCWDMDNGATDTLGDACVAYEDSLSWCGGYDDNDFDSVAMCFPKPKDGRRERPNRAHPALTPLTD